MRPYDAPGDDGNDGRSGGWVSRVVPRELALRALAVDVRGPEAVTLGEPARFLVSVRNRLPITLAVTLPTSRLWGWSVDGADEADERGYGPPDATRTVAFGRRERRVFEAWWDGCVRRSGEGAKRGDGDDGRTTVGSDRFESGERSDEGGRNDAGNGRENDAANGGGNDTGHGGGDVWVPLEGRVTFTGYLAADDWKRRGLYDRREVLVRR